jgi:hypothetical protein
MTRFIQYPWDKTKMEEASKFAKENPDVQSVRSIPGVKDVQFSFCPGQGWLAARYIFNDLEDMKKFPEARTLKMPADSHVLTPFMTTARIFAGTAVQGS